MIVRDFIGWKLSLARFLVIVIGHCVGGHPIKPGREWCASPLEAREIRERPVKDVGGDVLRLLPVADAPRNESVHAVEILLVQLAKAARILLRRLDQQPLVHFSTVSTSEGRKSHG